ncbi:MAG: V-type ATPase subunit [Candidatus Micrarchaeia archaeon]
MSILGNAMMYGYSNARVKAMESKLIKKEAMESMIAVKSSDSAIGMLLQTDYKHDIEAYGNVGVAGNLLDFALSKNLGREVSRLISITPKNDKKFINAIAGIWDISNLKFMIAALGANKKFEEIVQYVVDSKYINPPAIKEAMATGSVDGAINKLILSTPYKVILYAALSAYKRSGILGAGAAIDLAYYNWLGGVVAELQKSDRSVASLIKKDISIQNILMMLRAKELGMQFGDIKGNMVPFGMLSIKEMESIYGSSKSVEELASGISIFDLKYAISEYSKGRTGRRLLLFEIAMRAQIYAEAMRSIRHSVLSFGAIAAFFYLKDAEVLMLRVLINGKRYGLNDEEIKGMIPWYR